MYAIFMLHPKYKKDVYGIGSVLKVIVNAHVQRDVICDKNGLHQEIIEAIESISYAFNGVDGFMSNGRIA